MDYRYTPEGDALLACRNLDDSFDPDRDGFVTQAKLDAQRGRWPGSDGADFTGGVDELVREGWAELNAEGDACRLSPTGMVNRERVLRPKS